MSLADGEDVEFDVEVEGGDKRRAVRVTGLGGAPVKGSESPRTAGEDFKSFDDR